MRKEYALYTRLLFHFLSELIIPKALLESLVLQVVNCCHMARCLVGGCQEGVWHKLYILVSVIDIMFPSGQMMANDIYSRGHYWG